ncbi:MAG: hypothetical protein ABIE47_08960, partial [Pseudomonadota bacterium]
MRDQFFHFISIILSFSLNSKRQFNHDTSCCAPWDVFSVCIPLGSKKNFQTKKAAPVFQIPDAALVETIALTYTPNFLIIQLFHAVFYPNHLYPVDGSSFKEIQQTKPLQSQR